MSGLAGMGIATCYVASERRVRSLNFMSLIPRKFPLEKLNSREQIVRGPIPVGSPGNLAGWCEMASTYGTKKLPELFAPAIAVARDGFGLIEFTSKRSAGHLQLPEGKLIMKVENLSEGISAAARWARVEQPESRQHAGSSAQKYRDCCTAARWASCRTADDSAARSPDIEDFKVQGSPRSAPAIAAAPFTCRRRPVRRSHTS